MIVVRTIGGPLDGMRHTLDDAEHADGVWLTREAGTSEVAEYRHAAGDVDDAGRPIYRHVEQGEGAQR